MKFTLEIRIFCKRSLAFMGHDAEGLSTAKTASCNDLITFLPGNKYMFKVIIRNTRKKCEIYSSLTIKTPERRH